MEKLTDLELIELNKANLRRTMDEIQERASSILLLNIQWKDMEKVVDSAQSSIEERLKEVISKEEEMEERAKKLEKEIERRENSVKDQFEALKVKEEELGRQFRDLELGKKYCEERLREVELEQKELEEKQGEFVLKEKAFDKCCRDFELEKKDLERCRKDLQFSVEQCEQQCKEFKLMEEVVNDKLGEIRLKENDLENCLSDYVLREQQFGLKEKSFEKRCMEFELEEKALEERRRDLEVSVKQCERQCEEFKLMEKSVKDKLEEVGVKEKYLEKCLSEYELKEEQIELKEKSFVKRYMEFEREEKAFKERCRDLEVNVKLYEQKYKRLEVTEKWVQKQLEEIKRKEEEFELRERDFGQRCRVVELSENCLQNGIKDLKLKSEQCEERFRELKLMEESVTTRFEDLEEKEEKFRWKLDHFEQRSTDYTMKETSLEKGRQDLDAKQKHNEECLREIKLREKRIEESSEELAKKYKLQFEDLECKVKQYDQRFMELELKEKLSLAFAMHPQVKNEAAGSLSIKCSMDHSSPAHLRFCIHMDGKDLQMFLNGRWKEHGSIGTEVAMVLQLSGDPAKLVLDAMEGFYPPHLSKGDREFAGDVARRSCILLLEQLMKLSPEIKPNVRKEAMKLAFDWITKMRVEPGHELEVLGFLRLLASFQLADAFDADELVNYLVFAAQHIHTPELFKVLGLGDKIKGFIRKLVEKKQHMEAIRFIYAFEQVNEFPPVPVLKDFINHSKIEAKRIFRNGNKTPEARNEADIKRLADLRAVAKCIEDHKLEDEYRPYNLKNLKDLIICLEKENKSSSLTSPKANPVLCTARESDTPSQQHGGIKRPREFMETQIVGDAPLGATTTKMDSKHLKGLKQDEKVPPCPLGEQMEEPNCKPLQRQDSEKKHNATTGAPAVPSLVLPAASSTAPATISAPKQQENELKCPGTALSQTHSNPNPYPVTDYYSWEALARHGDEVGS
ncbi:hypothetical protein V6Z11_A11G267900 [Gossypium hirsutum]